MSTPRLVASCAFLIMLTGTGCVACRSESRPAMSLPGSAPVAAHTGATVPRVAPDVPVASGAQVPPSYDPDLDESPSRPPGTTRMRMQDHFERSARDRALDRRRRSRPSPRSRDPDRLRPRRQRAPGLGALPRPDARRRLRAGPRGLAARGLPAGGTPGHGVRTSARSRHCAGEPRSDVVRGRTTRARARSTRLAAGYDRR